MSKDWVIKSATKTYNSWYEFIYTVRFACVYCFENWNLSIREQKTKVKKVAKPFDVIKVTFL